VTEVEAESWITIKASRERARARILLFSQKMAKTTPNGANSLSVK
jgi:hypothetical protein